MTLTDKQLKETVDAYEECGSQREAARRLGISQSTLSARLVQAQSRGVAGGVVGTVPAGQTLSGVSTLYSPSGRVRAQWVKSRAHRTAEETIEIIRAAFLDLAPGPVARAPDEPTAHSLLAVYPLADLHLGMYAWKEETGNDYDLGIATTITKGAMSELVASTPSARTAILLNLGDFFHSDSNENRTRRSGNVLDVDTRYAKVLQTGVELLVELVYMLLGRHTEVIVRNLPGNHDPYAALALTIALAAYFRDNKRVQVDTDPGPFFFHRFGNVLIGAAHGDMVKAIDMPGVMAAKRAWDWGQTKHRYIYTGHLHSKRAMVSETGGAHVEVFQTLAPRDAWGNSMGYTAARSVVSITHHITDGEKMRLTHTVQGAQ